MSVESNHKKLGFHSFYIFGGFLKFISLLIDFYFVKDRGEGKQLLDHR